MFLENPNPAIVPSDQPMTIPPTLSDRKSQVLEGGKIVHQAAVQGSWDGGTGA